MPDRYRVELMHDPVFNKVSLFFPHTHTHTHTRTHAHTHTHTVVVFSDCARYQLLLAYSPHSNPDTAVLMLPPAKGTGFTEREKDRFGLRGLVPPVVNTLEQQVARVYRGFHR